MAAGRRQEAGDSDVRMYGGTLRHLAPMLTNVAKILQVLDHDDAFFDDCYAESALCGLLAARVQNKWNASGDSSTSQR